MTDLESFSQDFSTLLLFLKQHNRKNEIILIKNLLNDNIKLYQEIERIQNEQKRSDQEGK